MVHPLREWPEGLSIDDVEPPFMDHRVGGGQPCQYSHHMARIILRRVECGESVQQIAADPAMPSYRTIYDWLQRIRDFGDAWDELRGEQAAARRAAKLAPRPRGRGGRKSTYTPKLAEAWAELIMGGYTLREAAAVPGMPGVATVHNWLRLHADFRETYRWALYARDQRLAEQVIDIASTATPFDFAEAKAAARPLQGLMGALRPDLWRWWD